MARQGQAAGAGDHAAASRLFGFAKKHKGQAKGLGDLLQQLGFENEGEALVAVSAVLAEADDGTPGLQRVLGAIALHARATERRAYVLLDEIHLLAAIDQAQEGISRWCHEAGSPIVFIFAGSEESAAQALRERGQPMAAIGEEFELSEIAPEDWIPGLRSRFAEARVKIERSELETILRASGCHPRRTMLVASRVRATALMSPARIATPTEVELSIQEARKDRSWR